MGIVSSNLVTRKPLSELLAWCVQNVFNCRLRTLKGLGSLDRTMSILLFRFENVSTHNVRLVFGVQYGGKVGVKNDSVVIFCTFTSAINQA